MGTGFWHRYPLTAIWAVLSFYLAFLWVGIAADMLWFRWGRGVAGEKMQVAVMCGLIIAALGAEHLAIAILLT